MTRQGALWEQDGFSVVPAGLRVTGQPTLGAWSRAMRYVTGGRSALQWAIGDLLLYADSRDWEAEAVEEVMDATGLKRGTLLNLKSVSKSFPMSRRRPELPWSHHQVVASLESDAADLLLDQSSEQKWGWEELREHARTARHEAARTVQTFPEGTFGLLMATPPWRSMTTPRHVLNVDEISALAPHVQAITAPDAVLYLAAAFGQLEDGCAVMRAWGFTLRGHLVITSPIPLHENEFARVRHTVVLMGTRGRPLPPPVSIDSIVSSVSESLVSVLGMAYRDVPRVALFSVPEDPLPEDWVRWDHRAVVQAEPVRAIRITEGANSTTESAAAFEAVHASSTLAPSAT